MPEFNIPLLSEEFTAAICDVPRMVLADRIRLVQLLPSIAEKFPAFGMSLGEKLANDQNQKVGHELFKVLPDILCLNKGAGFHIAKSLAHKDGDIAKAVIQKFDMLGRHDFEATISLGHNIINECRYSCVLDKLAESLAPLFAHATDDTQKKAVFELGLVLANDSHNSLARFINEASFFVENYPREMMDLIDRSMAQPVEEEGTYEMHLAIANNLVSLSKADPQWGAALMLEISGYHVFPDKEPDPPGVITMRYDPYNHVRSQIVKQLGGLIKVDSEAVFSFAELCAQNWALKSELAHQLPSFAKVDLKRTLTLCETLCANNHWSSWRAFPEALIEMTSLSKDKRIYRLIDRLLKEGDEYAVRSFTEKMQHLKVPKNIRDEWIARIYQNPGVNKTEMGDSIKAAVVAISNEPAIEARSGMAAVLNNHLALKF